MQVLLVSYTAPPATTPRAFRVAAVAKWLQRLGHRVEVLSVDEQGRDHKLVEKMGAATRFQTPAGPLQKRRGAPTTRAPGYASSTARWGAGLRTLVVPEWQAEWLLGLMRHHPDLSRPDVVISFVPYFTSALVGHRLARQFSVPHVIDYGDPWSHRQEPRPTWRYRLDVALERRIVGAAAGVIVNTEPQLQKMQEWFSPTRITCLSNGFDPDDYGVAPPVAKDELRHLGALYGIRLPLDRLTAALAETQSFAKVVSYGARDGVQAPDGFDERPPVDFHTSLQLMQGAGALLVVGNRGGLQIPSKVYHYLGAGRPILAVVESLNDPIAKLNAGEMLVSAVNEPQALVLALKRLRSLVERSFEPPPAFGWHGISRDYAAFLEDARR